MSDQKNALESLCRSALQIHSLEKRAEFLARACGDDESLRKSVEQRLEAMEAEVQSETVIRDNCGVEIGDAGESVLKSLSQHVQVPRVKLREPEQAAADSAAQRLASWLPNRESDRRYQLQGEIARGGMGMVLKGRDTDLGRDLAIKVLLESHRDNPEVIGRFIEEAQISGQLQHPGIAPVYELGQFADRQPYISMKLVKGETLSKLLADRKDPTEDRGRFLGIFRQLCQTMAYAHSRGVIHRDLKPANVMVGAFGEVQVMDWGLAKVLGSGPREQDSTPGEQARV